MTIKTREWHEWTCIHLLVVWKHEFLVILQRFFHCGFTQLCGASLPIHYNGNRRRQLHWSIVMDWPLPPQWKRGQCIGLISMYIYFVIASRCPDTTRILYTFTCMLYHCNNVQEFQHSSCISMVTNIELITAMSCKMSFLSAPERYWELSPHEPKSL